MRTFDISESEKLNTEAKEKWGKTAAYKEHIEKTKHYSKEKWNSLVEGMNDIFSKFTHCMKNGQGYESKEVQKLVEKLQNYITENYYLCTNEILSGLGKMYIGDDRFKDNIDKNGAGTAEFISAAIDYYCKK